MIRWARISANTGLRVMWGWDAVAFGVALLRHKKFILGSARWWQRDLVVYLGPLSIGLCVFRGETT